MKRPSFQFYPADWRNNAKLRRCSEAARGAWMDVLCVLHDMDEYGICRWPLADLARSANVSLKLVKELVDKDVLKGADKNAEAYIFTPRHAGKDGEPVTLVENNGSPLWYCSRFVRDEYIRQRRGQSTRFDEENQPPKTKPKATPKPTIGDDLGDGSTSSSTSTSKTNELTHTVEDLPEFEKTPVGIVCSAIKREFDLNNTAITDMNQSNPKFLACIEAGATVDEFVSAAQSAIKNGKGFSYLVGIVVKQREEAAKLKLHKGALPAKTDREAGRQVAAASIFKAEHTAHLQGNKLKLVESSDEPKAIAN